MSISRIAVAALLMTIATTGWSQTSPEEHAAHHPPEKAQASVPAPAMADSATTVLKDGSAATRRLIERAEQAKTAAERERLLDEHLAAMRKQLAALNSQKCAMEEMSGAAMGGKPADDKRPDMMGDGMKTGDGMKGDHMMMCHQMMKVRLETMADLLEQTWRREELRKKGAR
jgi:hypothetical protein